MRAFPAKTTLVAAVCSIFVSCTSPRSASRHADTAAAVAQRTHQLSAQFERIEREQRSPELRRLAHTARTAWLAYVRANRSAEAAYTASGIALDTDYYRLENRLLD